VATVSDLSTAERDGIDVDDLIAFGSFPQSSASGVAEPIEWRVLDRAAGAVLLLSDRILECRRYHPEFVETTWRDSDLRAWLNSEFFRAAFGDDEKALSGTTSPRTASSTGARGGGRGPSCRWRTVAQREPPSSARAVT
jgi:hypothetical protein